MSDQKKPCIFCDVLSDTSNINSAEACVRVDGCKCCPYIILWRDMKKHLEDPSWRDGIPRNRLSMLLRERWHREHYNGRQVAHILMFDNKDAPEVPQGVAIRVKELLDTWPTVPEQIERGLCSLVYFNPHLIAGQPISLHANSDNDGVFLTNDWMTQQYMLDAMCRYGWLTPYGSQTDTRQHIVQPEGWKKFDELTRSMSSLKNPAFVAMWFGGEEEPKKREMSELFELSIKPAVNRAGFRANRADTDEHNEVIMDKMLYDIQIAPFVVAELSDDNRGVYYEAGYAKGRGLDVFMCVREGHKVHFDLSGVNHVKWKTPSDLAERLEARIRATQGQGPFDPPDGEVASKG